MEGTLVASSNSLRIIMQLACSIVRLVDVAKNRAREINLRTDGSETQVQDLEYFQFDWGVGDAGSTQCCNYVIRLVEGEVCRRVAARVCEICPATIATASAVSKTSLMQQLIIKQDRVCMGAHTSHH
jgi:hypothetical protein